jgi:hypothetical protein
MERSSKMHIISRTGLGVLAAAAVAMTIWIVARHPHMTVVAPPAPIAPAAPRSHAPPPQPAPAAAPTAPEPADEPPPVTAGDAETTWMPAGYVHPAHTTELVAYLNAWLADTGRAPRIDYRGGVLFAESAEDRGDDGPYPRSAEREAMHVCGTQATWLRHTLYDAMKHAEVVCANNVCAFGGMEYQPRGFAVFHETTYDGEPAWVLDAWVSVFYATLADQIRAKNFADVAAAMTRLRGASCTGEPAGAY